MRLSNLVGTKMNKIINVVELDSRDIRFQSGIERYFKVMAAGLPGNVRVLRIIFYHSPDIKDVRIVPSDAEVSIYHPTGFPAMTLWEAVWSMIGVRLSGMKNLIIKSNCLGCEGFA